MPALVDRFPALYILAFHYAQKPEKKIHCIYVLLLTQEIEYKLLKCNHKLRKYFFNWLSYSIVWAPS